MRPEHWWDTWHLGEILESSLPDFVLAFAFFTSLAYAVLAKRFDQQRPAIAVSTTLGLALSIGLVWWEQANGYSIKDLGPIAIGFAILVLAFVMYQSIRQIGGSWAGALVTIGAAIVIAQLVGLPVPIDWQILQTVIVVALILGIITFTSHYHRTNPQVRISSPARPNVGPSMADLHRDRHLSGRVDRELGKLRNEAKLIKKHPQQAGNVLLQIKRLLPAEGYLTQRMAQLRQKAYQTRKGHIARLEETRQALVRLPPSVKKKAAAQLTAKYNHMIGIETRLERLNKSVAENEKRIRDLTAKAQTHTAQYQHKELYDDLKAAQTLQHHNSRLFKIIEQTEHKLSAIAKQIAQEVKHVEKPNERTHGSADRSGPAL